VCLLEFGQKSVAFLLHPEFVKGHLDICMQHFDGHRLHQVAERFGNLGAAN
jgi:hypothetical protein